MGYLTCPKGKISDLSPGQGIWPPGPVQPSEHSQRRCKTPFEKVQNKFALCRSEQRWQRPQGLFLKAKVLYIAQTMGDKGRIWINQWHVTVCWTVIIQGPVQPSEHSERFNFCWQQQTVCAVNDLCSANGHVSLIYIQILPLSPIVWAI